MSHLETFEIPAVPFGPEGDPRAVDAMYYREAARNIRWHAERGTVVLGSNLTETVARLCEAAAAALDRDDPPRELRCEDCGRDYPVWFAPNDIWNMGGPERPAFECPSCFAKKYEAWIGGTVAWTFAPEHIPHAPATEHIHIADGDYWAGCRRCYHDRLDGIPPLGSQSQGSGS